MPRWWPRIPLPWSWGRSVQQRYIESFGQGEVEAAVFEFPQVLRIEPSLPQRPILALAIDMLINNGYEEYMACDIET